MSSPSQGLHIPKTANGSLTSLKFMGVVKKNVRGVDKWVGESIPLTMKLHLSCCLFAPHSQNPVHASATEFNTA